MTLRSKLSRSLVIAFAALIACTQSPPETQSATPESAAGPAKTSADPSADADVSPQLTDAREPAKPAVTRNIFINKVTVANPLIVKGRARTFENSLMVRARRGDEILTEIPVMSVGEMGTHNPYTAQLWLTKHPGDSVTVEAFEYSARDGSVQSLVTNTVRYPVPTTRAKLHFPAGDCTRFVAVERTLPASTGRARLLVEALVAGPDGTDRQRGASPAFPKGSAVRGVNLRNGVLTIDFNERLQNVGGSCAVQAIRESVTRTMRELPTVKKMVITAGGSEALALQP